MQIVGGQNGCIYEIHFETKQLNVTENLKFKIGYSYRKVGVTRIWTLNLTWIRLVLSDKKS
jgi:hypothetical protein